VRGGMSAAFISLEDVICKDSIATNGQVISWIWNRVLSLSLRSAFPERLVYEVRQKCRSIEGKWSVSCVQAARVMFSRQRMKESWLFYMSPQSILAFLMKCTFLSRLFKYSYWIPRLDSKQWGGGFNLQLACLVVLVEGKCLYVLFTHLFYFVYSAPIMI
jgi:hypothetical protein